MATRADVRPDAPGATPAVDGVDQDGAAVDAGSEGASPAASAAHILDPRQRQVLASVSLLFVAFLLLAPLAAVVTLMAATTAAYLAVVGQRLLITKRSLDDTDVVSVSDEEARAIPDHDLPVYTVLVPAYREAPVIEALAAHLRAIEYPRDRLDVKLLLEEDDLETIEAAQRAAPDVQIVLIPPGGPRTKPKALNAGLERSYGAFVTIYDAEDIPDPLQLRRAVVAFRRLPPDVACLQAQLTFHDWDHNIITRWFTIEYLMWFTLFLPGLSSMNAPVPLGGTSNHIRRDVLDAVGAWDAYNVTEDADLGIRLHTHGWHTGVLGSETLEEPNSDFVNWVKQRSRWYKGYLQTWLVHLRHPVELWRSLGPDGFTQFNLFVGGTPLLALLNPFFWVMTLVWFTGHATLIERVFPAPLYHLALFCWIVGNVAVLYVTVIAARRSGHTSLVWAACLVPLYWVMMSMAAIKASWQVFAAPSFWEKTTHGLAVGDAAPPGVDAPGPPIGAGAVGAFPPPAPPLATADGATLATRPLLVFTPSNASGARAANGSDPNGGAPRPVSPPVVVRAAPGPPRWASFGRVLRVVGLLAALFVGYLVFGTAWRADSAQRGLRGSLAAAHGGTPRVGAPVARLVAPGLDTVVVEGVGLAQLNRAPGHVPGSAFPGGAGNAVVVGHRVAAGGPFGRLDGLKRGDTVELAAPWGRARYRVTSVGTRPAGAIDVSEPGAPRLTLVTAGPGLGLGDRVVVGARLTSPVSARAPRPVATAPTLPTSDPRAPMLLATACLAGLLAWYARRWLAPAWGALGAALFVLPFVVIAVAEAFTVAVRLLPPTF